MIRNWENRLEESEEEHPFDDTPPRSESFDPTDNIPDEEWLMMNDDVVPEVSPLPPSKACRRLDFSGIHRARVHYSTAPVTLSNVNPSDQMHSPIKSVPDHSPLRYFVPQNWQKGYSCPPKLQVDEQPLDLRVHREISVDKMEHGSTNAIKATSGQLPDSRGSSPNRMCGLPFKKRLRFSH